MGKCSKRKNNRRSKSRSRGRNHGKSHQTVVNMLPSRLQKYNKHTKKYDLLCECGAVVSAKNWKRHAHKPGAHDCAAMYAKYYEKDEACSRAEMLQLKRMVEQQAKQIERFTGAKAKADAEKRYKIQQELTLDPPMVGNAAMKHYLDFYQAPLYNQAAILSSARRADREGTFWYIDYLERRLDASNKHGATADYEHVFYKVVRDKKGEPLKCVIGDSEPIAWTEFLLVMYTHLRKISTKVYQLARQNSFEPKYREIYKEQMTYTCNTTSPMRTADKKWPDPFAYWIPDDDSYKEEI